MKLKNVSLLTMLFSAQVVLAQNAFENLDFEQARIVPVVQDSIVFAESIPALPGWIPYIGNTPMTGVLYNNLTIGSPMVSIHDRGSSLISGNYSVVIQHTVIGITSAGIGQTGQLPTDALSLTFYASPLYSFASLDQLQVTFDGNIIPLVEMERTDKYSIVGGDISAFAGHTGELRFTTLPTHGSFAMDQIQFSPLPIPEPSTWALLGLGGLLTGFVRWQVSRRK